MHHSTHHRASPHATCTTLHTIAYPHKPHAPLYTPSRIPTRHTHHSTHHRVSPHATRFALHALTLDVVCGLRWRLMLSIRSISPKAGDKPLKLHGTIEWISRIFLQGNISYLEICSSLWGIRNIFFFDTVTCENYVSIGLFYNKQVSRIAKIKWVLKRSKQAQMANSWIHYPY